MAAQRSVEPDAGAGAPDIRGNTPALEAVLAEGEGSRVDAVVVTGDVLTGPDPRGTLDLLLALPYPVHFIRGNADQEVVDAVDGRYPATGDHDWDALTLWTAPHMARTTRDLIAGWPTKATLPIDGIGDVLFVHATPRSLMDIVLVDTPMAGWDAVLAGTDAAAIVLGHTLMPFYRRVDRCLVANAGSVGMPYGHDGASSLVLGPTVVFRQTVYDVEAASRRILAVGCSGASEFVRDYVQSHPSDREALTAFRATWGGVEGARIRCGICVRDSAPRSKRSLLPRLFIRGRSDKHMTQGEAIVAGADDVTLASKTYPSKNRSAG